MSVPLSVKPDVKPDNRHHACSFCSSSTLEPCNCVDSLHPCDYNSLLDVSNSARSSRLPTSLSQSTALFGRSSLEGTQTSAMSDPFRVAGTPVCVSVSPVLKPVCPILKSACPILKSACPILKSVCPVLKSACPMLKSVCPILKSSLSVQYWSLVCPILKSSLSVQYWNLVCLSNTEV